MQVNTEPFLCEDNRYHYTYRMILDESKKFYVGRHSSSKYPTKDKYIGSGNWVQSIKDKSKLHRVELEYFNNINELITAEQIIINKYFGTDNCMNILNNSVGFLPGHRQSPEAIKKAADAIRGKKRSSVTRAKISASHKGKKKSAESIKKSSDARRGYKQTPEHIKKVVDANRGRTHTDESKLKISIANSGKTRSDECKAMMSEIYKQNNSARKILNNKNVKEIKILLFLKYTSIYIANKYGTNPATISDIKNNRSWKHIIITPKDIEQYQRNYAIMEV